MIEAGNLIRNIYQIERHLGESSLGDYYIAVVTSDGRKVKLEILEDADQENIDRLSREIELLASFDHPNIFRAFDAGQDGNLFFLASEYEEGETLEEILKRGPIDPVSCVIIASEIASALNYAWDHSKILHRDLKPTNMFITETQKTKLMGFGIAKSGEGQSMGLTGVGFTVGTPEYMSPEQIRAVDDLDFRSDMYGLSCVLYEMLTGSLPFIEEAPILLMQKQMDEDPEPVNVRNPEVSQAIANVVQKMMQKDRDDRYQSWQDLEADFQSVIDGRASDAPAAAPEAAPEAGTAAPPMPEETAAQAQPEKKGCAAALVAIGLIAGIGTGLGSYFI
ncbi:MAG: serine/threonine protein kinase [Lentisphaeria bacterium]|nr:serine/threonine protein kinase [Lentisphaeria bacterium]NQZ70766.1 serine/threonine protein kinase [Lentisphaeria bacterium]